MEQDFIEIVKAAKQASLKIAELKTEVKNLALNRIADAFVDARDEIFAANKRS